MLKLSDLKNTKVYQEALREGEELAKLAMAPRVNLIRG